MKRKKTNYKKKFKKRILYENGYFTSATSRGIFKRNVGKHFGFIGYYYDVENDRLKYSSMQHNKKRLKRLANKKYRKLRTFEEKGGKSNINRKYFSLYWELY